MADIAVLGAGGWGMALAISATGAGNSVTIWSPFEEEVKMLSEKRTNERLLSGVTLPESIKITTDMSCVEGRGAYNYRNPLYRCAQRCGAAVGV